MAGSCTGSAIWRRGHFFSPSYSGSDPSNTNTVGGLAEPHVQRKSAIRTSAASSTGSTPGAFAPPPVGTLGNSGPFVLEGPGYNNQNVSIAKTFAITERFHFTFTASASDAFNHPNFYLPAANISVPAAWEGSAAWWMALPAVKSNYAGVCSSELRRSRRQRGCGTLESLQVRRREIALLQERNADHRADPSGGIIHRNRNRGPGVDGLRPGLHITRLVFFQVARENGLAALQRQPGHTFSSRHPRHHLLHRRRNIHGRGQAKPSILK